tara:strand:- start:327 stop:1400 length:1074 start_codon:yes stop_codon:yes gene_type:complete
MANVIQIKKSAYDGTTAPSGTGVNAQLAYGELGWLNNNGSAGKLFIGGKDNSNSGFIVDIQQNILNAAPTATAHASAPTLGKAGFLSENFEVTAGKVKIKDGGVILGTETTGNYVATAVAGTAISVSGSTGNVTITNTGVTSAVAGEGIDVSGGTGAVTISAEDATASNKGIASFNSTNFSVSSGAVSIAADGIEAGDIADNAVVLGNLANSSVPTAALANNAVNADKLANNAVDTNAIQNDAVTADKIANNITLAGNCGVSGNWLIGGTLTVEGGTTTIESTTLTVEDKNIVVASDQSGDPTTVAGVHGAGLTVGTNASAPKIEWMNLDSTDYFQVTNGNFKATLESSTIDCGSYS